ncbi:MAG: hypothetical protein PHS73_01995 [Candidatus Peribacteraceae bacterium]|nr:hypothetical protein [Candidatus Peribacteraceae bacterium]
MEARHDNDPAPTAEQLESEIDAFQAQFVERLHQWLASLEGHRFESQVEARALIREVSRIARKTGRQLMYQGKPVHLVATIGTRQTKPSISILGGGKHIKSSVTFPKLETGPIIIRDASV